MHVWRDRSEIGEHVLDFVSLLLLDILRSMGRLGIYVDGFASDLLFLLGVDFLHEIVEHFLSNKQSTSTSSSSEASPSMSCILSLIYF